MTRHLPVDGVTFATARFSEIDPDAPESLLPKGQLEAYNRLRQTTRKQARLAGRLAARRAMQLFLHRNEDFKLDVDTSGRPVDPQGRCFISISHTGHEAFAVAADFPVGLDIERVEVREASFESLFLTPSEQRSLPGDPTLRARLVTRAWCALEANAKALGCGLTRPFRALRPPPGLVRSGCWSDGPQELAWAVATNSGS